MHVYCLRISELRDHTNNFAEFRSGSVNQTCPALRGPDPLRYPMRHDAQSGHAPTSYLAVVPRRFRWAGSGRKLVSRPGCSSTNLGWTLGG